MGTNELPALQLDNITNMQNINYNLKVDNEHQLEFILQKNLQINQQSNQITAMKYQIEQKDA